MTPGLTTDRDFKTSVENSAGSNALIAANLHGANIFIAGANERESMEADMF